MTKWCKWYCFAPNNSEEAKKICKNPNCNNKKRAEQIAKKELRKIFEKRLLEAEKNLY